MNNQTWRFVFNGNCENVNLFNIKNDVMSWLTSGIDLANLHLWAEIRGGNCKIEVKNPTPETYNFGEKYIATVIYPH